MAHLSLSGSQLHVGTSFDENPAVREILDDPNARPMLLFPGPDAVDPSLLDEPPTHLIVVDGTWSTAAKVVRRNASLSALPKLGLTPESPGRYRIRKEPDAHGLATIEAVAKVLEALAKKPGAFDGLLVPFDRMVESQLAHAASGKGRMRHGDSNKRRPVDALREVWEELVVLQAEGNEGPGGFELVHLVAVRPSTNEWFERVIKPRHPLAPRTSRHTGLAPEELEAGGDVDEAREAWMRFSADATLAGWGMFSPSLLETESFEERQFIDLRALTGLVLARKVGGSEKAAEALAVDIPNAPFYGRAALLAASHAAVAKGLVKGRR